MIDLRHMSCVDLFQQLDDESVDMTLTDIPYQECTRKSGGLRNLDYGSADILVGTDVETITEEIIRITSGSIYMFCGIGQISEIHNIMRSYGLSTRLCCWNKTNPSPINGQHLWLAGLEYCVFGRKSNAVFNEHCKSPLWSTGKGSRKGHPTSKPVELFTRIIKASSNEGDLVFDPFSGSGTTAVSCKANNRRFIGCELNKDYYDYSITRL